MREVVDFRKSGHNFDSKGQMEFLQYTPLIQRVYNFASSSGLSQGFLVRTRLGVSNAPFSANAPSITEGGGGGGGGGGAKLNHTHILNVLLVR